MADVMRGKRYKRGYVLRVGPRYIDARDPNGRLRLSNGAHINVHAYSEDEWATLEADGEFGIAWEGDANLSRFVNHCSHPNAKFRRGWLVTTTQIHAGSELFVRCGSDFLNTLESEE